MFTSFLDVLCTMYFSLFKKHCEYFQACNETTVGSCKAPANTHDMHSWHSDTVFVSNTDLARIYWVIIIIITLNLADKHQSH